MSRQDLRPSCSSSFENPSGEVNCALIGDKAVISLDGCTGACRFPLCQVAVDNESGFPPTTATSLEPASLKR